MSLVRVKNLWVAYKDVVAVKGVSFEIPRGEVFGFIGPNGAGKTSTIRVLATLQQPRSGSVTLDGIDVVRNPQDVRPRIGYVPDSFGVYDDLTVEEYLHFFAAAYRVESYRRKKLIDEVLGLTDLGHKLKAQVDSLSRGMKQRLNLARVLLHDPEFLLLDEPASGLDPRARVEVREFLKELRSMGKTILVSSHILHELAQFCTQVGIIEAGRMITAGPLEDIYKLLEIGRRVTVEISNLSDDLLRKIRRVPGVASADVDENAGALAIQVREEVVDLEALLQTLIDLGARIRRFQPEAMDMEKAFMKLTEGKTA